MFNAIRNSSTDYHQKFDTFIKNINDKCSEELNNIKGSGKFSIKKQIYKAITHLCEKYNNSICSIHSHNKRVVARAYQSYKKNNNYIGDALKINANNFDEKCLDFQFVKSLKGKELDKFCAVLQKDETLRKFFVAKNCDKLLKSENNAVFNALPLYAKAVFFKQITGDQTFISGFFKIYKNELLDPKNKGFFNKLPVKEKLAFINQNKNDKKFASKFLKIYKDEKLSSDEKFFAKNLPLYAFVDQNQSNINLLSEYFYLLAKYLIKEENKAIFNALPLEVKVGLVKRYEDNHDPKSISDFCKTYKNELLAPENKAIFNALPMEEKMAFIEQNKADIIKNPSLLASADKDSILSIITNIKDDISLQRALIQSYTCVTKEIAEEALNANNQESENINQTTTDNFTKLLKGEITQEKFGSIESVQLLSDCNRGYTFEFSCSSGTVKLTEEDNKTADGEHFLSKQDILNTILEQSKEFSAEDKEALADFVTNCSVQGLFAGAISGTNIPLKIDGDGRPFIKANKSSDGLHVNVITKGVCSSAGGISVQNEVWKLGDIKVDKNEFELFYPKSILNCKGKSKKINVLEINQKQDLPITQNEMMEHDALRKIKNEDGSNGVLSTDEFGAFMKNSNIVNDNLKYLDKNPAALRKIPKETLQKHIEIALNGKNEPLANALVKAADYMDSTIFEENLHLENQKTDSKKTKKNAEPLVHFFTQNEISSLDNKDFEVLKDAIRQIKIKFITKEGKEISIGGDQFNNQQEALDNIKQQIQEQKLTEEEINALADFIANGNSQTYLNIPNGKLGFYRWDGDGNAYITARMTETGLNVNVKTQGKLNRDDKNQVVILASNNHQAVLEKTVNADVTFHYEGSIGKNQGTVNKVTVNKFEQEIGDVTINYL